MKHYTTIEQSKKLLELGLNPKSADMWWLYVTAQGKHIAMMYEEPDSHYLARMESYGIQDAAIPCWSLGALLDVMPKIKEFYYPSLYKASFSVTACMYSTQDHDIFKIYTGEDFLEAAFNMVVYLLENGYIKGFQSQNTINKM